MSAVSLRTAGPSTVTPFKPTAQLTVMPVGLEAPPPVDLFEGASIAQAATAAPPSLKRNSTGKAVETWQKHLIQLGYLSKSKLGSGMGVFGPMTEEATKQFQREHKLNVSGAVGPATRKAMTDALAARGTYLSDPAWKGVMSYKKYVDRFAHQYGVPADLVLAMMKLESNGQNLPPNKDGAVGPMQITHWWDHLGNRFDPIDNIRMSCQILQQLRASHPSYGWDGAVRSYFSGQPYPSEASDGYNTVNQYLATVKKNLGTLQSAATVNEPGAVDLGDKSSAVKAWQQQLVKLGYLLNKDVKNGDGYFGPKTDAATRQFQQDHGLPVTGVFNAATKTKAKEALQKLDALGGKTLERGQNNEAVRVWQTKLVRLGYLTQQQMNTGPGTFGPMTEAATRAFQQDHGLNVSGRVGEASQAKMTKVLESGVQPPKPSGPPPVRNISQLYSVGTEDDWNRLSNCGPASVAMIAKAFGFHTHDWSDGKLVNWLGGQANVGSAGIGWPGVQTMAKAAGLTTSAPMFGSDLDWVRAQLKAGKLVAANGDRSVTLAHSSYTDGVSGGHWIVIKGIDAQGNFLVEDPSTDCKKLSPSEMNRYFDTRVGGGVGIAIGK